MDDGRWKMEDGRCENWKWEKVKMNYKRISVGKNC
jgi:hypothetical protein